MSRGRKPKSNDTNLSWQQIFNKNVGKYLQYIIIELGKTKNKQKETGADLLKKIKAEKGNTKKDKELPPIKIEEIPFEIAKNWVWCRLGDIADIVRGGSPRPAGDPTFYGGNIPFLKVGDLTGYDDIYLRTHTHSITEAGLNKTRFVEADTLMLTNSGATLGIPRICTFPTTFNDGIAAFLNLIHIDKVYLYYFLKSKSAWYLNEASRGQGQPNLNTDIIALTPFPLPPLSEQQKIVDFLTDFENDNLRDEDCYFSFEVEQKVIDLHKSQLKGFEIANELNYQLSLVKNLRQQLLQDAVQGKLVKNVIARHEATEGGESAHDLLKRIKAEKEQLIKDKKLKKEKELPPIKAEEIPFAIPNDWVWCRLGEICDNITKGSSPKWQGVEYVDEDKGILYITSKNVDSFTIDLTKATYVEEKFNEIEPRSILKKGDILTNIVGASIGRTALFDLDVVANINQAVCILRIEHKNIDKDYLLYLMNSDFALKMMSDSQFAPGRANLSMGNIAAFTIPLPPLSIQHRIVEKVESLMQICAALETSIQTSARENEQLLQQVLREALEG